MNMYNKHDQLVIATIIDGKPEIGFKEGEFQKVFDGFLKSKGISDARWEIFKDSGVIVVTTSILLDGNIVWEPVFSKHITINSVSNDDFGIAGKSCSDQYKDQNRVTLYLDMKEYCDASLFNDFKEFVAGLILRDKALGDIDAALEPKVFIADISVVNRTKKPGLPRNFAIKNYASNDSSLFEVSDYAETNLFGRLRVLVGAYLPPVSFSKVFDSLQIREAAENTVGSGGNTKHPAYLKACSDLKVFFAGWQAKDLNAYRNGYFGFMESSIFWQAFFGDFSDLQPKISIQKTSELTNGTLVKIITCEDDQREKAYMYDANLFSFDQLGLALAFISDNSGKHYDSYSVKTYLSDFIGMLFFKELPVGKPKPYNTDMRVTLIADRIYSIKRLFPLRTEEEAYLDVYAGNLLASVSLAKQNDDPTQITEYCLFETSDDKKILVVSVGGAMESIYISEYDHLLVNELIESVLSLQSDSNFHEVKPAIREAFYMFDQKSLFAVAADKI
ncbi:hypothetical protein [Psychrobacter sp. UBA3480]|uniref:hypothetical protein n=1 Tax=Psychrobacter sp. UBA3480 TaxID=1947350 RepID=UPI0025FE6379|nr:hypothetical protein [Psychrobacter sp. UBA3480]